MKLVRFEDAGAIFSDSLSSVKDLKDRGFSVSNVVVGDSPFGSACVFNGVDSVINTGSAWLPTEEMTISVWIYPYSYGEVAGRIIYNSDFSSKSYLYITPTGERAGYADLTISGSNQIITPEGSVVLNQWQHFVVTRTNTGDLDFYINGLKATNTKPGTGTVIAGGEVTIGNSIWGDRTFDGLISNLIVWNKTLSADEIMALYKSQVFDYEKNVIADFDMSSVNPVNNSFRSSGIVGVGSNVVVKSDWITGLEFDGVDSIVDTGSDWLSFGDLSVSVWIKPYGFGENTLGRIIDNGNSFINLYDAGLRVEYRISGNSQVYSSNIIETNKWQHIVVTRSASGLVNFYVNGELSGTPDQNAGTPIAGTTNVMIGNNQGLTRTFDGLISKLKVFDCVLTSLQVKDLYDKELGGRR